MAYMYNRDFCRVDNDVFQGNLLDYTLPPHLRARPPQLLGQGLAGPVPFLSSVTANVAVNQPYRSRSSQQQHRARFFSDRQSARRDNRSPYVARTINTSLSGKSNPTVSTVSSSYRPISNQSSSAPQHTYPLSNISTPAHETTSTTNRQYPTSSVMTSSTQKSQATSRQPDSQNPTSSVLSRSKGKNKAKKAGTKDTTQHYCETCKISCYGDQTWKMHLEGQRHKKKVSMSSNVADVEGSLKCELCNVTVTGEDGMKLHVNGSKHNKTLKLHLILGKPIPQLPSICSTADSATSPLSSEINDIVTEAAQHEPIQPTQNPLTQKSKSPVQQREPLLSTPSALSSFASDIQTSTASVTDVTDEEMLDTLIVVDCSDEAHEGVVGEEYVTALLPSEKLPKGGFECSLCSCVFNDDVARRLHVRGRKHKMMYKKKFQPDLVVDVQPSKARRRRLYKKRVEASKLNRQRKIETETRPQLMENAKPQQQRNDLGHRVSTSHHRYSSDVDINDIPLKLDQPYDSLVDHQFNFSLPERHQPQLYELDFTNPFHSERQTPTELQQHDDWASSDAHLATKHTHYEYHHTEDDYSDYRFDTQEEDYDDRRGYYDDLDYSDDIHYEASDSQYTRDFLNKERRYQQTYNNHKRYRDGTRYVDETAAYGRHPEYSEETYYTDDTNVYAKRWAGSYDDYD
ncbi:zinc finger RNA-binding protein-like [Corticium candelabrum]|uniref:zinc finger RNA-binding protein-like n=1 Tax=Corticium candelabrum TaxID=121492 RepID=UPI002E26B5C1|nr:zinc finger RNA-binding protein-like [Corticium candelabrum]